MSLRTAASDPQTTPMVLRQPGQRPPGPVEQPVGLQPPAGLGHHGGHRAVADRRHLVGDQLKLAPLVVPAEGADHAHPLPGDRPAPGGPARRAHHADLGGPVAQGEVHPARSDPGRPVHLALHRDPAHGGDRRAISAASRTRRDGPGPVGSRAETAAGSPVAEATCHIGQFHLIPQPAAGPPFAAPVTRLLRAAVTPRSEQSRGKSDAPRDRASGRPALAAPVRRSTGGRRVRGPG